jgi:uncharacterized membrane protein YphA (DoxX/SURF4 family)
MRALKAGARGYLLKAMLRQELLETIRATGEPVSIIKDLFEAIGGTLLVAGFWTPITGTFVAIRELWIAFSMRSSPQGAQWIHILLAVFTAGVAMLGPGAWSIDARLFGKKRFDM